MTRSGKEGPPGPTPLYQRSPGAQESLREKLLPCDNTRGGRGDKCEPAGNGVERLRRGKGNEALDVWAPEKKIIT